MSPKSHGQLLLTSLYRGLLRRMRALRFQAQSCATAFEALPPRRMMSVTPSGNEIQINQTLADQQVTPDIAVRSDGTFVAVWTADHDLDGDKKGIFARRFAANGTPIGNEFQVNVNGAGEQDEPAIAMAADGKFTVVWTTHGAGDDVIRRTFDANGNPLTGDVVVNTTLTGNQHLPDVAMDSAGNFVVVWQGQGVGDNDGVFAQRFLPNGTAAGTETLVNAVTGGSQDDPAVAVSSGGAFVVTHTRDQGGTSTIFAQRFNSSGVGQGEFVVHASAGDDEDHSAVAMNSSGQFIVAWEEKNSDQNNMGVLSRRFAASGAALDASDVQVNTEGDKDQISPTVAIDLFGNTIVAWKSEEQDGDKYGVYGQAIRADGTGDGGEFHVATTTSGEQGDPAIAWAGNRAVVVWGGEGTLDNDGVSAQLYNTNYIPAGAVSWWQAESNALDTYANNNGALTNGATFATGRVGTAFSFDGTNDYVQIGNPASLRMTNGLTLDAWIYPKGDGSGNNSDGNNEGWGGMIMNKEGEYEITRYGDGEIRSAIARPNGTWVWLRSGYYAPLNAWTHVSVTFNAGIVTLYVNGSARASYNNGATTIGEVASGLNDFRIGGRQGDSQYFDGLIDEPKVFNTALSSAEIAQIHATDTSTGNSAPSLGGTENFPSLTEDPATNPGTLVSDLIAGHYDDADPNPALGIAVTAVNNTNGTWQYTTNGSTWNNFGSPTGAAARLLAADANTRIRFVPSANYNGTITNGVTFRAWDKTTGVAGSTANVTVNGGQTAFSAATASPDIAVTAVNDGPVNSVPGAQTTPEDTGIIFSSANGNAISIVDVDSGTNSIRVTLGVTSGRLTLASTSNLSFTVGDGTNDATMTFTGRLSAVNTALAGLSFAPTSNMNGSATLTISTNDLGNTGSGGSLSDTDNVALTITAVNDAPVNHMPASQTATGGSVLNLGSGVGTAISVSDIDAGNSPLRVTLSASVGTLTLATTAGLTFISGDGNADSSMVFEGTQTAINTALDGMDYNPPLLLLGNANIDITTSDKGATGAGGAKTDSDTLIVGVSPANQPPVNSVPGAQTMVEDGNLVFSSTGGNGISIDDPDSGSGLIRVTLTASTGLLSLANTGGLTFLTGNGNADPVVSFRATLADVNNALEGLVYIPPADYSGNATIQLVANDQGNSGAGGAKTDTDTVTIAVSAVNDQPVIQLPGAGQTVNEDVVKTFSSGNGNLISITDVDAASGTMHATLSVTNGVLTLSGIAGLTFISGDGTDDSLLDFTGTRAAINTALNGLRFTPTADFYGTATLSIVANDQGNTGQGAGVDVSDSMNITVNSVNDAPIIATPSSPSGTEDTPIVFSSANSDAITVSDIDANGNSIRLTISSANVTFTLSTTAGLTFLSGDGTDDSSLIFTGTVTAINAALDGITFTPAANFNGSTSVLFIASDQGFSGAGGTNSVNNSFTVNFAAVNDAPVLTVNSGTLTFTENDSPPKIDQSLDITDVDNTTLNGATVTIVNYVSGEDVLDFSNQGGVSGTFDSNTGILTLSGSANISNYRAALRAVRYSNASENPTAGTRQIRFDITDGTTAATSGTRSVAVVSVNDAPTTSLPPAQSTNEDTPLVLSSANSNAITIADLDAGTNSVRVTLTAGNGVVTLATLTGLTFITGDGASDGVMTFDGSLASINAALDGLSFAPTANFNGAATLQVQTNDLGNSGGAPETNDVTLAIAIGAVNDAPVALPFAGSSVAEDASPTTIHAATQFTNDDGALTYALTGNSNSSLFDSVTIDPATGDVVIKYAANAHGVSQLTVRATDGGGLSTDLAFNATVTSVNDLPTLAKNSALQLNQGAIGVINEELLRVADADNTDSEIIYKLTKLPKVGSIIVNGAPATVGQTITQADISNDRVKYANAGVAVAADSFAFTVNDGTGGTIPETTFQIIVKLKAKEQPLTPPSPPSPPSPPPTPAPPTPTESENKPKEDDAPLPQAPPSSTPTPPPTSSGAPSGGAGAAAAPAEAVPQLPPPKPEAAGKEQLPAAPAKQEAAAPAAPIEIPAPVVVLAPPPVAAAPAPAPAPPPVVLTPEGVAFIAEPASRLATELDSMHKEIVQEADALKLMAGSASFVSLGLSVVYILWTIRAGYLVASLLSSMPAWTFVDPLPILNYGLHPDGHKRKPGDDDESLETLVRKSEKKFDTQAA